MNGAMKNASMSKLSKAGISGALLCVGIALSPSIAAAPSVVPDFFSNDVR